MENVKMTKGPEDSTRMVQSIPVWLRSQGTTAGGAVGPSQGSLLDVPVWLPSGSLSSLFTSHSGVVWDVNLMVQPSAAVNFPLGAALATSLKGSALFTCDFSDL